MAEAEAPRYAFTVFTPTFDRAHTLPRVYESLKAQTFTDFEWLVVDDGSTDGTRALIARWADEAPFPVRYFYQENSGMHVAENLALQEARGSFYTTLSSDDWFLPTSLAGFDAIWRSIDERERPAFASVGGLCATADGAIIGDPFPEDVLDSTLVELERLRVGGDKAGCGRVEVARRFPFPVVEGEKLVVSSLVYRRIGREYRTRFVNEVLKIVEYQPTGLSAAGRSRFVDNPRTSKLVALEELRTGSPSRARRFRTYVNHTRWALHAGLGGRSFVDAPSKGAWLLTLPLAVALYARDQREGGRTG